MLGFFNAVNSCVTCTHCYTTRYGETNTEIGSFTIPYQPAQRSADLILGLDERRFRFISSATNAFVFRRLLVIGHDAKIKATKAVNDRIHRHSIAS